MRSLAELLNQRGFEARLRDTVLMHSHCHEKALWGAGAERDLLSRCGAQVLDPDTGCCGVAGPYACR